MSRKHVSAPAVGMACVMCLSLALSCGIAIHDSNVKSKIKLPAKALKMYEGDSYRIKIKKCKWKTSNKKVAAVSKKGKIKAKKAGKAKITVRKKKGGAKAVINIKVGKHATGIKIEGAMSIFLNMNQTGKIQATVMPAKVLYKDIEYIVANTNIVSVSSDGTITPKSPGTTSVSVVSKATSSNNIKVSSSVNVIVAGGQSEDDSNNRQDLTESQDDFNIIVPSAKPTEPAPPTESAKPTEPAGPTEPASPTDPAAPTDSAKPSSSPGVTDKPVVTDTPAPPTDAPTPTPTKAPMTMQEYINSLKPDPNEPLVGSVVAANSAGEERTVYFMNNSYTGGVNVSFDGYSYSKSGSVVDFLKRLENETIRTTNSAGTIEVYRRRKADSWRITMLETGKVYYASGKVQDTIYNSGYGIMIVEGNTIDNIVIKGQ